MAASSFVIVLTYLSDNNFFMISPTSTPPRRHQCIFSAYSNYRCRKHIVEHRFEPHIFAKQDERGRNWEFEVPGAGERYRRVLQLRNVCLKRKWQDPHSWLRQEATCI